MGEGDYIVLNYDLGLIGLVWISLYGASSPRVFVREYFLSTRLGTVHIQH